MSIFLKKEGSLLMSFLVSVGIIALLTSISIPYLRKYQPNLKLSSTARNLTADIRYAQQQTISQQIVHKVVMDSTFDSYEIIKIDIATTTIKTVSLDSEIDFDEINGLTGNQVIFNSYGGVSEPGQIILINNNETRAVINIKPSGYIELAI